jgi:mono/diheme cytochrome c family protein
MAVLTLGCGGMQQEPTKSADPAYDAVAHGRQMVLEHDCGACHRGGTNPAAKGWLAGAPSVNDTFMVGPFAVRARNLTPDSATGTGRYTERQIFNTLRFGLLLSNSPNAVITSNVPGEGNFPAQPKYVAPAMPWVGWRHMTDKELLAIAAYLKHGVKPVSNKVEPSQAPPDAWASAYTEDKIGKYPAVPYPAASEVAPGMLPAGTQQKVLRGRHLVLNHACGGCHSTRMDPSDEDWLGGIRTVQQEWQIGPYKTRPRNLTPDNTTGMGRFTERQIFNALRFGLRPGETPDVEITSTTPGQGNFPLSPKYLAPPMPWTAWRHMSDDDLWAIAAYLKHGLKPYRNRVADSDGPPDFWADVYAPAKIGPYPAPRFPTLNEINRPNKATQ